MKKKCCQKRYWKTIGNALNGKILTQLTECLLFLIPIFVSSLHLFSFDGVNILLTICFQTHLSIWNPSHDTFLLFWLYLLYIYGIAMVLMIFAALYCGVSTQFWLKFASHTFLSKSYRKSNCYIPKFKFRHYQQLRLMASIFNQSFANKVFTGKAYRQHHSWRIQKFHIADHFANNFMHNL